MLPGMDNAKPNKQAHLHPFARILRGDDASDLDRRVTVGLDDDGTVRTVARGLRGMHREEAEALARVLEETARHLRDGWRGEHGGLLH